MRFCGHPLPAFFILDLRFCYISGPLPGPRPHGPGTAWPQHHGAPAPYGPGSTWPFAGAKGSIPNSVFWARTCQNVVLGLIRARMAPNLDLRASPGSFFRNGSPGSNQIQPSCQRWPEILRDLGRDLSNFPDLPQMENRA